MNNLEVFKVIVISALVTVSLRLLPLFVKIPKNPIMNKFFEALPYSVLALMVFPDIFTSGGTTPYDIVKILIGMGIAYIPFGLTVGLIAKNNGMYTIVTAAMSVGIYASG